MALGCLALSAGLSAALAWQSTRSSVVPYVVEVDNLGAAQAVAPALAEYRPTDPQIAWHRARFVENVRQVPADPIVLRQSWLRAYDFATDRGAIAFNDFARVNDPFALVGTRRSPSRSQASSAPRTRASALPGSSAVIKSVSSPPPSAGPPSWAS